MRWKDRQKKKRKEKKTDRHSQDLFSNRNLSIDVNLHNPQEFSAKTNSS
jgi:hypothetical protein